MISGEKAQALVSIAAMVAAAIGGQTPEQVGIAAMDGAERVRKLLERLEQLGETHVRDSMGCKRTPDCACLYCEARASEAAAAARKASPRARRIAKARAARRKTVRS